MRAVIYARYSSDLQSAESIADQVRLCRSYAERFGWHVAGLYSDRAISGASSARPEYQKLLADAKAGKFDLVVAEALDRLSRDQEDVAALYKRFQYYGVKLVTVAEGEVNELHVGLKGTMNALFLKDLAAKVRRGQQGRAVAGFVASGLAYGYAVVREIGPDGELVRGKRLIEEAQAGIIRRIFKEYVSGKSPRTIATELNAEGVPSPRGGCWNASTINGNRGRKQGILHNEAYLGRLLWNRQAYRKNPETGTRVPRYNPKTEWITTAAPDLRIVSDELWKQVQETKRSYGARPFHQARRPKRLLSGLVVCGVCGGPYTLHHADRYRCSRQAESGTCRNGRTVPFIDLERRVLKGLQEHLLNAEAFEAFAQEYREEMTRRNISGHDQRVQVEREIGALSTSISRLVSAIADGTDTPALRQRLRETEAKKEQLQNDFAAEPKSSVRNFPIDISQIYQHKISHLQEALNSDDTARAEAATLLRSASRKLLSSQCRSGVAIRRNSTVTPPRCSNL